MLFLFALSTQAMAGDLSNERIAIIDIQKVFTDSLASKSARDIHQRERKEKQAVYNAKEQEIVNIQEEIKNFTADTPEKLREEKVGRFNTENKKLTRLKEDLDADLQQQEQKLTNQVYRELNQILADFMKKENIKIIFPKTAVTSFDQSLDITDRIIKMYDSMVIIKKRK
jgi:outer membrane protein